MMFPIIWDIRSTGHIYREYCDIYDIEPLTDPVMELLEDAGQSGFNTAMIRSELYFIDVPGDYTFKVVDGFSPIQRTVPNTIPALDILTLADWSQTLTLDLSGMPSITKSIIELRPAFTPSLMEII